ncbi:hypothetical protein MXB_598, partial [Myxobolus squamalis]
IEMLIITSLIISTLNKFIYSRVKQPCLNTEWEDYKSEYNLEFSVNEDVYRKEIFIENFRYIMESNSKNLDLTLKMNMFGHLRFKFLNLKKPLGFYEDEDPIFVGKKIPLEFDWSQEGVVSPVKSQYKCGSCYAFSAVGAIESQFAIQIGQLRNLSVQEIVDCSVSYGNEACNGGYMEKVYEYVIDNGISTDSAYPYKARKQNCQKNNPNSSFKLVGYRGLRGGDENNLLRALFYIGPISIALNTESLDFAFYESGILDIVDCNPEMFTHGVLAVGYNLTGTPYLLAKNSSVMENIGESMDILRLLYIDIICVAFLPGQRIQ